MADTCAVGTITQPHDFAQGNNPANVYVGQCSHAKTLLLATDSTHVFLILRRWSGYR